MHDSTTQRAHAHASPQPIVALNHVGKTFSTPTGPLEIIQDVTFEVHPGKKVAIIGPSGSGKSTLLSLIGLLDVPTSGEIYIEGRSIAGLLEAELARIRNTTIGFVFQNFELIAPFTVAENIAAQRNIGGEELAKGELDDLAGTTGLTHRLNAFPRTLSGGEKQRVAIARALANQPKLLLADEPTGSLDRATGERVLSLLIDTTAQQGAALIIITHDESIAHRMDRIYQIRDGHLYAQS